MRYWSPCTPWERRAFTLGILAIFALMALFLSGCATAPKKVALPPEIIRVPMYMPLPIDCGATQTVVLPAGSTITDVAARLKDAVDAYNDQVKRCFDASRPPIQ